MFNLFSNRQKKQPCDTGKDVYQYDTLPKSFRVQVTHILIDAIGTPLQGYQGFREPRPNAIWLEIHGILLRERGDFYLYKSSVTPIEDCIGLYNRRILTAPVSVF